MKFRLALMIAALAIPCSGAPAQSVPDVAHAQIHQSFTPSSNSSAPRNDRQQFQKIRLLKLQREGLELQRQDGGTLTPEHHAMLQAKLDRINAQAQEH